jgi:hypothetical protein
LGPFLLQVPVVPGAMPSTPLKSPTCNPAHGILAGYPESKAGADSAWDAKCMLRREWADDDDRQLRGLHLTRTAPTGISHHHHVPAKETVETVELMETFCSNPPFRF